LSSRIFLEARKGVRADFSVRPSGTAAMRRVPYPLIPGTRRIASDLRWAVPELGGFLLHPVSRSETRRRLKQTPRELWPNRLWREAKKQAEIHLANVSIWRKQKRIDNEESVLEICVFLNPRNHKNVRIKGLFSIF